MITWSVTHNLRPTPLLILYSVQHDQPLASYIFFDTFSFPIMNGSFVSSLISRSFFKFGATTELFGSCVCVLVGVPCILPEVAMAFVKSPKVCTIRSSQKRSLSSKSMSGKWWKCRLCGWSNPKGVMVCNCGNSHDALVSSQFQVLPGKGQRKGQGNGV